MKNEVKKKMHELQLASLHQSHRKTRVKTKISTPLRENSSQRFPIAAVTMPSRRPRQHRFVVCGAAHRNATHVAAFLVFDHFRSPRIYNDSCEIFAGA
jgi:hypothetical protein